MFCSQISPGELTPSSEKEKTKDVDYVEIARKIRDACNHMKLDELATLITAAPSIVQECQEESALAMSVICRYGKNDTDCKTAKYLLDKGLKTDRGQPNTREGCAYIHLVCENGCLKLLDLLLPSYKSTDIHRSTDILGRTPLHLACSKGHLSIVKRLVEEALKSRSSEGFIRFILNDRDNGDHTPLHYACESGSSDIVQYLLEQGAIVNRSTLHTRETPLHIAVRKQSLSIVQKLCEHTASLYLTDKDGHTALQLAYSHLDDPSIFQYLVSRGATIDTLKRKERSKIYEASKTLEEYASKKRKCIKTFY